MFIESHCTYFRFWAVTHAHYIHSRNTRTIGFMISLVWISSVVVSLAPLLGWKDANWAERVEAGDCMVRVLFLIFLKRLFTKFKFI